MKSSTGRFAAPIVDEGGELIDAGPGRRAVDHAMAVRTDQCEVLEGSPVVALDVVRSAIAVGGEEVEAAGLTGDRLALVACVCDLPASQGCAALTAEMSTKDGAALVDTVVE
jgi:hypothetical protein